MKNITCEQVEAKRRAENEDKLQPLTKVRNMYGLFSQEDVLNATFLLYKHASCPSINLIKKKAINNEIEQDKVIDYLKKRANLSFISDNKMDCKLMSKLDLAMMLCFSNSFYMANMFWRNGHKTKVLAGTATLPNRHDDGTITMHTFTHAVVQIDDYIYDYNYDCKMKADYYLRLFSFGVICEIEGEEVARQQQILTYGIKYSIDSFRFNDLMYVTLANRDAMKRLCNYDVYKHDFIQ